MRVFLIGRFDGWMGVHMRQLARGFEQGGHETGLLDYHTLDHKGLLGIWPPRDSRAGILRRTRKLSERLRDFKPHLTLLALAHPIFDFAALRRAHTAPLAFYDMDGPALPCYQDLSWLSEVDLVTTVSRVTLRRLEAAGFTHVRYLPHGVDTAYYAPTSLSPATEARFKAPLSFIGRPTPRRADLLEQVADHGLCVWGRRWSQKPYAGNRRLAECVRERGDLIGREVVELYSASTMVINILREPFADPATIMNLQVFTVPSCGTCLITEWVEEIEEAFEPGVEILTFKSREELAATAARYAKSPQEAARIGLAGRRRCLAEHAHSKRAETIVNFLT